MQLLSCVLRVCVFVQKWIKPVLAVKRWFIPSKSWSVWIRWVLVFSLFSFRFVIGHRSILVVLHFFVIVTLVFVVVVVVYVRYLFLVVVGLFTLMFLFVFYVCVRCGLCSAIKCQLDYQQYTMGWNCPNCTYGDIGIWYKNP